VVLIYNSLLKGEVESRRLDIDLADEIVGFDSQEFA
jgi:hypothetical protein